MMGTIKDILAEMRKDIPRVVDAKVILSNYADRIEEAVTNCNQPVTGCHGLNTAEMREALEDIIDMINEWRADGGIQHWRYSQLFDIIDAALSKPPRNCDVLANAQEALTAIHDDRGFVQSPVDERRLTVNWLFDEVKPKREAETEGELNDR